MKNDLNRKKLLETKKTASRFTCRRYAGRTHPPYRL